VSPQDFRSEQYVICDGQYVLSVRPVDDIKPGYAGFSSAHRDWAQWSLTDPVSIATYDPFAYGGTAYLGSLDVEIGFASKKMSDESYDQDDLTKRFIKVYQPPPVNTVVNIPQC
jgi:vesicle-fusing ATPase